MNAHTMNHVMDLCDAMGLEAGRDWRLNQNGEITFLGSTTRRIIAFIMERPELYRHIVHEDGGPTFAELMSS